MNIFILSVVSNKVTLIKENFYYFIYVNILNFVYLLLYLIMEIIKRLDLFPIKANFLCLDNKR